LVWFIILSLFASVYSSSFSNTCFGLSDSPNDIENGSIDHDFLIKFSSRGGFAWQYNSIIYNSTNKHLIANNQNYDSIIGDTRSQTIKETELTGLQKQILWNIIKEGNV
jgi:hypothetical protein